MKRIEIVFEYDNATEAPVYKQYPSQHNPQRAYLEFNPDDESEMPVLTAGYNPEIGNAIPADVFNRKRLRWQIPSNSSRQSIETLSTNSNLAGFLAMIREGYTSDLITSGGHYSESAADAIEAVEWALHNAIDTVPVWSASEWISQSEIDLSALVKAGSVEEFVDKLKKDLPDAADFALVMGDLTEAVVNQLESQLGKVDDEDKNELELAAEAIRQAHHE